MKIRSLLITCLLAGQALPAVAMERPNDWAQKIIRTAVAATTNAEFVGTQVQRGTQFLVQGISQSMLPIANIINNHPFLTMGLALGAINLANPHSRRVWAGNLKGLAYWLLRGHTPLNDRLKKAVIYRDLEEAEYVLKQGAQTDHSQRKVQPLDYAIRFNDETTVDLLLKYGAIVHDDYLYTTLDIDPGYFNKSIAKKLIDAGANPDTIIPKLGMTIRQFAQAKAVETGNQDYINIFKLESKLL